MNLCLAPVTVENAASVTFLPPKQLMTGIGFIVFCKPGYLPETAQHGIMLCDKFGQWLNAPFCNHGVRDETTTQIKTTHRQTPDTTNMMKMSTQIISSTSIDSPSSTTMMTTTTEGITSATEHSTRQSSTTPITTTTTAAIDFGMLTLHSYSFLILYMFF